MKFGNGSGCIGLCVAGALGGAALADQVIIDDVIITEGLCVGDDCVSGEDFDLGVIDGVIRLKANKGIIDFVDVSTSGLPDRDWRIHINEDSGTPADEAFYIEDVTAGRNPFYITGDAPDNALFIAADGRIGLGTSLPEEELHIVAPVGPGIMFERTSSPAYKWEIRANHLAWYLQDSETGTLPILVEAGAGPSRLKIASSGNVGIGTQNPAAPFEVSTTNSFNFFRLTALGAGHNTNVDITFTGGPLGTGQLRYNIVDGDNQEMSLDADGNMVLDGTLTTAGPTCAGGCDRVFDADYPLPSIPEHAAQMYAAGHLPSLGPTAPGAPVNVSEKLGQVINALEHAHIYIARQDERLAQQSAEILGLRRVQTDLLARLEAIAPK